MPSTIDADSIGMQWVRHGEDTLTLIAQIQFEQERLIGAPEPFDGAQPALQPLSRGSPPRHSRQRRLDSPLRVSGGPMAAGAQQDKQAENRKDLHSPIYHRYFSYENLFRRFPAIIPIGADETTPDRAPSPNCSSSPAQ